MRQRASLLIERHLCSIYAFVPVATKRMRLMTYSNQCFVVTLTLVMLARRSWARHPVQLCYQVRSSLGTTERCRSPAWLSLRTASYYSGYRCSSVPFATPWSRLSLVTISVPLRPLLIFVCSTRCSWLLCPRIDRSRLCQLRYRLLKEKKIKVSDPFLSGKSSVEWYETILINCQDA